MRRILFFNFASSESLNICFENHSQLMTHSDDYYCAFNQWPLSSNSWTFHHKFDTNSLENGQNIYFAWNIAFFWYSACLLITPLLPSKPGYSTRLRHFWSKTSLWKTPPSSVWVAARSSSSVSETECPHPPLLSSVIKLTSGSISMHRL